MRRTNTLPFVRGVEHVVPKGRMQRFARELEITGETRVLDVGGTPETWDMVAERPRVTLLNTPRTKAELAGASWWVAGDGRTLPFRDGAFDVVFSNSVIEHVGDAESQRRFAGEVARVKWRGWAAPIGCRRRTAGSRWSSIC